MVKTNFFPRKTVLEYGAQMGSLQPHAARAASKGFMVVEQGPVVPWAMNDDQNWNHMQPHPLWMV